MKKPRCKYKKENKTIQIFSILFIFYFFTYNLLPHTTHLSICNLRHTYLYSPLRLPLPLPENKPPKPVTTRKQPKTYKLLHTKSDGRQSHPGDFPIQVERIHIGHSRNEIHHRLQFGI